MPRRHTASLELPEKHADHPLAFPRYRALHISREGKGVLQQLDLFPLGHRFPPQSVWNGK